MQRLFEGMSLQKFMLSLAVVLKTVGDLAHEGATSPPQPSFLSVKQFATVVGLSEKTVLRRISDKSLQATRTGRLLRIPGSELDRLLKAARPRRGVAAGGPDAGR